MTSRAVGGKEDYAVITAALRGLIRSVLSGALCLGTSTAVEVETADDLPALS